MTNWRAIPGYEGQYEISDTGSVRGLNRIDSRGRKWRGKSIRPRLDKDGYHRVSLTQGGVTKEFNIHRLVLMAFVGLPRAGQIALHSDGSKTNNTPQNLRWGTCKDNYADAVAHGVFGRGLFNPVCRINATDVERVRDLRAAGLTYKEIANWIGVSGATVSNICNGMQRFAQSNQSHGLS
jgi:hypothetical protein